MNVCFTNVNYSKSFFMYAAGFDDTLQLGIKPTVKYNKFNCVDTLKLLNIDLSDVQCISGGFFHSVIVKAGIVLAAGDNRDFCISGDKNTILKSFTEVKISHEAISWAACGKYFTIYLTVKGKVILWHKEANGKRINVNLPKKAVSVFAGRDYGGIIDENGSFYIIDEDDLQNPPRQFNIGFPVVDLVCCTNFICVLTSEGCVYVNGSLNNSSEEFVLVPSLSDKKVEKLSGYYDTCAALTTDGRVFIYGNNEYGQLGNGTQKDDYSSFIEINLNEEIKDVSCSFHTLILTKSNEIFGCGSNLCCQLLKKTDGQENILIPTNFVYIEASQVIACQSHSFVLSEIQKLENPAKKLFYKLDNSRKTPQDEKIDTILALCQAQSQSIDRLTSLCHNLQQKIESNENEIQSMKNELRAQNNNFKQVNDKIDVVVKYIKDLDFY